MPAYSNYLNYSSPWQQPLMGQASFTPYPQQSYALPAFQSPQFMIQIDGEVGARAWQPQSALPPNTVIPLWDYDGVHVYFKSTDAYGRMNPIRKARVVFEDEQQTLPQGNSGAQADPSQAAPGVQADNYVTKEDVKTLKEELKDELREIIAQNLPHASGNQNGSNNSNNGRGNRG